MKSQSRRQAGESRYLVHVPDPFRPVDGRHRFPIALTELLDDADIEHVRQAAFQLQSRWFCFEGNDFTQWNRYCLGKMVAGAMLRNQFHGAISNYLAFCELLQRHSDTKRIDIRPDPGIVPGIWQNECGRLGIDFQIVFEKENKTHREVLGARTVQRRLKNALFPFMSPLRGRSKPQTNSRPLAMLIASGSLTLRHTDLCSALESSPNINIVRNTDVLSPRQRKSILKRTSAAARTQFARRWRVFHHHLGRSRLLHEALQGGHEHLISILRTTFLDRLPRVAAEVETAKLSLSSCRPTFVISEAQPGNEDFVWSSVAQSLGIPVISIPHELWALPRNAYDFPPASDYVMVPSPLSKSWWIEKGFSDDAILPVRCRFLDPWQRKRSEVRQFTVLCALKRHTPGVMDVPVTHTRQFLQSMISIARERPEVQFIIKFHPGTPRLEGQAAFARQMEYVESHAPLNVEVAPLNSNLSSYLRRTDCLACPAYSFTVFEALANGIPCILAPPNSTILDPCPIFIAMKKHSRVTELEKLGNEIDAVKEQGDDIAADWFEGVLYSEPEPIEVVEELAYRLGQPRNFSRAAA